MFPLFCHHFLQHQSSTEDLGDKYSDTSSINHFSSTLQICIAALYGNENSESQCI